MTWGVSRNLIEVTWSHLEVVGEHPFDLKHLYSSETLLNFAWIMSFRRTIYGEFAMSFYDLPRGDQRRPYQAPRRTLETPKRKILVGDRPPLSPLMARNLRMPHGLIKYVDDVTCLIICRGGCAIFQYHGRICVVGSVVVLASQQSFGSSIQGEA